MNIAARAHVPLGEFMLRGGGSTDPSKRPNDPFVLYSIPAFDAGKPELVSGQDIGSPKKKVACGDVLLSRIVPHIRRSWIVADHADSEILASGEWIVFRSKKIYGPYLRHFLVSDVFHPQFMKTVAGVGGSLLRAKPDYVAEITIPLPPLDEQQRIAAILDKADALRLKRKRAIDLLDSFPQSLFLEMFGEPVGSIDHEVEAIGDVICGIESGWSPSCLDRAANDGEPGVLKLSAVTSSEFIAGENKALPSELQPKAGTEVAVGDILLCRKNTRELVGSSVYVWNTRPNLHMSDLIFRVVPERSRFNA